MIDGHVVVGLTGHGVKASEGNRSDLMIAVAYAAPSRRHANHENLCLTV